MVTVQGIYKGGDTVTIDTRPLPLISEPCEVIVTFLHPKQNFQSRSDQELMDKRQAGFGTFMKYKQSLSADFDYRKEWYGHIN